MALTSARRIRRALRRFWPELGISESAIMDEEWKRYSIMLDSHNRREGTGCGGLF